MATHSGILAWESPWAEQPGRRQRDNTEHSHTGDFAFVYLSVLSKFSTSMNLIYILKMIECITTVLNLKKLRSLFFFWCEISITHCIVPSTNSLFFRRVVVFENILLKESVRLESELQMKEQNRSTW